MLVHNMQNMYYMQICKIFNLAPPPPRSLYTLMGPIGRCLSAFCIADNKAVVFPPDSCIKEASRKEQLLVQAVAAISLAAAQSLEAALDCFQYHQHFQVAMMASPRHLKVRILTMKP